MKKYAVALASAVFAMSIAGPVLAKDKTIAVSWKIFQEERWKTDEAIIKKIVEANGDKYISADAQGSAAKQLTDVESLMSQGADVLLIVPYDSEAIMPAVEKAAAEGIPMIAYDVQIEHPSVLYMTFDNVGVGRLMAKEIVKVKPEGNYAVIKGDPGDPNATFLYNGMIEVLKPSLDSGKIKIVGEASSDGWKPENAQKNMEQILTANNNAVDAVLSENDGMAGGVVAALQAQGLAGTVPVTGQDGDKAALNRVAQGTQLVSIWKDSRALGKIAAEAALMLSEGKSMEEVPNVGKFKDGARKVEMNAVLLAPTPILKDNLNAVIDAGWVDKATVCAGVDAASVAACK
ncbi:substrate-binding domain-containing protein [Rhizobium sp. KVB221]|uniref:Substrate-binding domain-containing protein n=2 Tax=Rhizobium setariae TaxID=2801340 RepID=A0A937CMR9_9HYPH|nr:substrate-binding domain-containing protein [Rhizobium setariae]